MLDVCLLVKVFPRGHTVNTEDGIVIGAVSLSRSGKMIPSAEG